MEKSSGDFIRFYTGVYESLRALRIRVHYPPDIRFARTRARIKIYLKYIIYVFMILYIYIYACTTISITLSTDIE